MELSFLWVCWSNEESQLMSELDLRIFTKNCNTLLVLVCDTHTHVMQHKPFPFPPCFVHICPTEC